MPAEEDALEWKTGNYLDVLEVLRPGFELEISNRFFAERCSKCSHARSAYVVAGIGNCPLDSEFDEYMTLQIARIAEEIKRGRSIEEMSELSVEKRFSELTYS